MKNLTALLYSRANLRSTLSPTIANHNAFIYHRSEGGDVHRDK